MYPPPMRRSRLLALFMAWAWGIISASCGLNALIKSNDQEGTLKKLLPPTATLDINIDDVFHSGVVVTVASLLVAILCTIYLLLLVSTFSKGDRLARISRASESTLPIQWMTLAFCAIWIFATQIPFTVFFANNKAQIHASIGGQPIPQSLITQFEKSLGVSSTYKDIDYLRLVAIFPWITILFTTIAAVTCFLASRRRVKGDQSLRSTSTHRKSEEPV